MGNAASGDKGRHRYGYHVLRVKDNSPASLAGLRPFFDYIMAINGVRLDVEDSTLREQMEANQDKPVMLDVYSTREQALRKVEMIPRKWGNNEDGLIGCSIRFSLFDTINDIVWHVLDIIPNSPAEVAGLHAHSDYIIGTPLGIMRGERDLYELVECNIGEDIPLHVYNSDTNQVREVIIVPSEEWGGEGLLGCDVGYGYLHRLPRELNPQDEKAMLKHSVEDEQAASAKQLDAESSQGQHQNISESNQDEKHEQDSGSHTETQAAILRDVVPEKLLPEDQPAAHVPEVVEQTITQSIVSLQKNGIDGNPLTNDLESTLRISDAVGASQISDSVKASEIVPNDYKDKVSDVSLGPTEKLLISSNNSPVQMSHKQENFSNMPPIANTTNANVEDLDQQEINNAVIGKSTPSLSSPSSPNMPNDPAEQSQLNTSEQILSPNLEDTTSHQPPLAIAARMKPGLHGRGARVAHDGFSSRGKISLQDAQAQAQQQSAEYKAEKERIGSISFTEKSQSQGHREEETLALGDANNTELEVNEYIVEGMIRNMSLGSTIFPI